MRKLEFNVGSLGSRVVGYVHDRVKEQCQTHSTHPALIILPGGGYWMLSSREADPVALKFFAHAINTFTLYYPILDDIRKEKPVETLKACVQYIVDHAAFLGVDTSRMAVLGFSAGGHLAASYGTICKGEHLNTMLLGYPVISSRYMGLNGKTFKNLCQSEDEVEWYSLENRVDDDTLPSFIFHTADDAHIPVENSLVFAQRLSAHHIPFELHIYPSGAHGSSVCTNEVGSHNPVEGQWVGQALAWLCRTWNYVE